MDIKLQDVKNRREPDFEELRRVLRREKPSRPTLFEFFLNKELIESVNGEKYGTDDPDAEYIATMKAYKALGYDYVTVHPSDYYFTQGSRDVHGRSVSLNEGALITCREDFDKYVWKDPTEAYNGRLERLASMLPDGMKIVAYGPSGVLENAIAIMGYENLCYLICDDPQLVEEVFNEVGERIVKYYSLIADYDCVGALIANDDWGFNTQTMISPADMRKYVFPWHRKLTALAHKHSKPVILHSCGNLVKVMDDIIDDIGFDAKHSYEDKIQSVEQAYDMYAERIAIMGGIDLDFVCRGKKEDIYKRSAEMLQRGQKGYALGTGNSVPYYVPADNYYSMIAAALL